jgi:SAM-dependent methyltransferase
MNSSGSLIASARYGELVAHYESCLHTHGDNHRGVDWPNAADARTRYGVMLDVIRSGPPHTPASPVRLLDLGCGASHLYQYLCETDRGDVEYSGLDLSPEFVRLCRRKYPDRTYYCLDILDSTSDVPTFDYVVMNGLFTEKRSLSFDEMWSYVQAMLARAFEVASTGIAFNFMSKHVDWERDDLFHVPFDLIAEYLTRRLSRHFVLRNDYGLYEYTVYAYHARS